MPVNEIIDAHFEEIVHFAGVRMRITGVGNLDLQFLGLDYDINQILAPIAMTPTNWREPTRLANFISQRGFLKISTNQINEVFHINRIILFAKPIWSQFPSSLG